MAELMSSPTRKFNTVAKADPFNAGSLTSSDIREFNWVDSLFLKERGGIFQRGKDGVIQDFVKYEWYEEAGHYRQSTAFSIWTKSRPRSKSISLDIYCIYGGRPPTANEVKQAVELFKEELSRKGWLFRRARWACDLISSAESEWRWARR